jgi:hypothetical protein
MNDFFKKIKLTLPKILKGEMPDEDSEETKNGQKPLTNQDLVDKVFEVYKSRFKEETVEQEMLFPTCFRIYLHSTDFEARKEAFAVVSRAMANKFNAFNRAEMHKYKENTPKSSIWLFQFIEFKDGTIVNDIDGVQMGEVYTISTLFSQNFSKDKDNISNEKGVTMTKVPKNSTNPKEMYNFNADAFLSMEMLDGNRYEIGINKNYEYVTSVPKSEDKTQVYDIDALAYLLCDKNFISGAKTGNKYNIMTNYIYISGKNDARTGKEYVKVNYPLSDSIVQIKHDNGKFLLAAFGKVRLNGGLVKESKGGDLYWEELGDNSKILINGEVDIEFQRAKQ